MIAALQEEDHYETLFLIEMKMFIICVVIARIMWIFPLFL